MGAAPFGLPPHLVDFIAGHRPLADTPGMFALEVGWLAEAQGSRDRAERLRAQADRIPGAADSEAGREMSRVVAQVAKACDDHAEYCDATGAQIGQSAVDLEFNQLLVDATVCLLAAQLAVDALLFAYGAAKAAADRAAATATVRAARTTLLSRLGSTGSRFAAVRAAIPAPVAITAIGAVLGTGLGVGANAWAQQTQIDRQHRDSFDVGSLVESGVSGGFGGAAGGFAVLKAAPALARITSTTTNPVSRFVKHVAGTMLMGGGAGAVGGLAGLVPVLVNTGTITALDVKNALITGFGGGLVGSAVTGLRAAHATSTHVTAPVEVVAVVPEPVITRPGSVRRNATTDLPGLLDVARQADNGALMIGKSFHDHGAGATTVLMHSVRSVEADLVGGPRHLAAIRTATFASVDVDSRYTARLLDDPHQVARIMKTDGTLKFAEPPAGWGSADDRARHIARLSEAGFTNVRFSDSDPFYYANQPVELRAVRSDSPADAAPMTHDVPPPRGEPDGAHPLRTTDLARGRQALDAELTVLQATRDAAAERLGLDPHRSTADLLRTIRTEEARFNDPRRAALANDIAKYHQAKDRSDHLNDAMHELAKQRRIYAHYAAAEASAVDGTLFKDAAIKAQELSTALISKLEGEIGGLLTDPLLVVDRTTTPDPNAAVARELRDYYGYDVLSTPHRDLDAPPLSHDDLAGDVVLQQLPNPDKLAILLRSTGYDGTSVLVLDAGEPPFLLVNEMGSIMKTRAEDGASSAYNTDYPDSARGVFFDRHGRVVVPEGLDRMNAAHLDAHPFRIMDNPGTSGDGELAPGLWGKYGAAGALIRHIDASGAELFLLVKAADGYSEGNWMTPGGALNSHELPANAAAREIHEEVGASPEYLATLTSAGTHVTRVADGALSWQYHTYAADAPTRFDPVIDHTETEAARWVTRDELHALADAGLLHSGLRRTLPEVLDIFDPAEIVQAYRALPEVMLNHNLDYRVIANWIQNKLASHPEWQLVPPEGLVALRAYTDNGDLSAEINAALRSGDPVRIAQYKVFIDAMRGGLLHLERHEGTVFRGIRVTADDLPAVLARYQRDTEVVESAFVSADLVAGFGGNVRFTIESLNGREVKGFSARADIEDEVIFLPESRFEVTGRWQDPDGTWQIAMRELPQS